MQNMDLINLQLLDPCQNCQDRSNSACKHSKKYLMSDIILNLALLAVIVNCVC